MFSARVPDPGHTNALTRAIDAARAAQRPLLDLTVSNPTAVGLTSPSGVLSSLADPRALTYTPEARGLRSARDAVAADYARRGESVDPDRILLTASTSEAYALLFKLLCDAGDVVLVPQPSYPLFEWLTRLDLVEARAYQLEYHGVWSIDRASVERACDERTRAILIVSPNNPTGSMLRAADRTWLRALCAARGIAIIADEVFADYPLTRRPDAVAALGGEVNPALTFALGGLSKSAGLPQIKLGWMAVDGPAALVSAALDRLEMIADTYLSVSTPVQWAAPALIAAGAATRLAIQTRIRRNLDACRRHVAAHPAVTLLDPEGGWSVVLQIPAIASEEAVAIEALTRASVLVHPGYFFDFAREAFLVVSLLPMPDIFDDALTRLLTLIHAEATR